MGDWAVMRFGVSRTGRAKARMSTRRKGVTVALVLVLAAGLGFGGWRFDSYLNNAAVTCMNSGVTVVLHRGSDCVGITDGTYQFDPGYKQLDEVEDKIKAEDQKVQASASASKKSYVSVAYLLPFPENQKNSTKQSSIVPIKSAAEELAGAYSAQMYANAHSVENIWGPQIKLLIVNNGANGEGYRIADHYIESDVKSQNLVAVAGIGVSLKQTVVEVNSLAKSGIPVFGSDISSDDFDHINNMVRVTPSNSAMVSALLEYLKNKYRNAFLVQGKGANDSYVKTLRSDLPHFAGGNNGIMQSQEYDSSVGEEGVTNRLGEIAQAVCASHAQVVLFAGRGEDLGAMLSSFGNEGQCVNPNNRDGKTAIVTGSDVTNLQLTSAMKAGLKYVDLYYGGEVIPGEWNNGTCAREASAIGQTGAGNFAQTYPFGRQLPVQDGVAMVGYDAMLTAASATRLADADGKTVPSPSGVAGELSALQGKQDSVPGASGPISFANYANPNPKDVNNRSNPARKVFPILQLLPSGEAKLIQCVQTNP